MGAWGGWREGGAGSVRGSGVRFGGVVCAIGEKACWGVRRSGQPTISAADMAPRHPWTRILGPSSDQIRAVAGRGRWAALDWWR
jgi:hypothetical protein